MFLLFVSFVLYFLTAYTMLALLALISHGRLRYYVCYAFFGVSEGVLSLMITPMAIWYYRDPKCLGFASDIIRLISYPLGISWEIRNAEKLKRGSKAVIVSNHQSMIDILGMQYMHRFMGTYTSLAKKELLYFIPWGPSAWLGGLVFMDRKDTGSKTAAIKEAMHHFQRGVKIWFFAEGTRNPSQEELLPFKKGAFHMAVDCKTGIIPVVFSPYAFIDHRKKEFKRGKVIISVLDEVKTEGLTSESVDQLVREMHKKMSDEYFRLVIEASESTREGNI